MTAWYMSVLSEKGTCLFHRILVPQLGMWCGIGYGKIEWCGLWRDCGVYCGEDCGGTVVWTMWAMSLPTSDQQNLRSSWGLLRSVDSLRLPPCFSMDVCRMFKTRLLHCQTGIAFKASLVTVSCFKKVLSQGKSFLPARRLHLFFPLLI